MRHDIAKLQDRAAGDRYLHEREDRFALLHHDTTAQTLSEDDMTATIATHDTTAQTPCPRCNGVGTYVVADTIIDCWQCVLIPVRTEDLHKVHTEAAAALTRSCERLALLARQWDAAHDELHRIDTKQNELTAAQTLFGRQSPEYAVMDAYHTGAVRRLQAATSARDALTSAMRAECDIMSAAWKITGPDEDDRNWPADMPPDVTDILDHWASINHTAMYFDPWGND